MARLRAGLGPLFTLLTPTAIPLCKRLGGLSRALNPDGEASVIDWSNLQSLHDVFQQGPLDEPGIAPLGTPDRITGRPNRDISGALG